MGLSPGIDGFPDRGEKFRDDVVAASTLAFRHQQPSIDERRQVLRRNQLADLRVGAVHGIAHAEADGCEV